MEWKRQGAGLVGSIKLRDGRVGKVVLVGSRENPKGAMLVLATEEPGGALAIPFLEAVSLVHPRNVVEVLCAQERDFGASGLSPIEMP